MPLWYRFVRDAASWLIRICLVWEVKGLENVPAGGNVLIIANHLSMKDVPLVGAAIPRKITFLAKEELFHHPFGSLVIKPFRPVPVDRRGFSRGSLQRLIDVLKGGGVVGVFPEGSRSKTGGMNQAMAGVAFVGCHAGCTVLPVGIAGSDKLTGWGWLFARKRVTVNIGRAFPLDADRDKRGGRDYQGVADSMMHRVAELLPAEYRGYYGKADQ